MLTDSQAYTRTGAGHGAEAVPDPFSQQVLARLEPQVREVVAQAVAACRTADGVDIARLAALVPRKVADLVSGLDPQLPRSVLVDGFEPTSAALASALKLLRGKPLHRDNLPTAIDEVLRWDPPVPIVLRVNSVADSAGNVVQGDIAAANRDPKRFPEPDRFDLARTPNQHLSFGRGAHYCPGAALARLQIAITIEEVCGLRTERLSSPEWTTPP
jgi:cytochrome P450